MVKPRIAELVLVTSDGRQVGSLPAMPVATPWWQDVGPVVGAAREVHGVDVIAGCGFKDSLVHGDFHPGNFRGDGRSLALLDWGDSGVGHPLLDQPAFLDAIPNNAAGAVRVHWLRQWLKAVPGSDPARASLLLAPIAAARQAVIYRRFLDNIEPSEQPYHRADPAKWLSRTAALVREGHEEGV